MARGTAHNASVIAALIVGAGFLLILLGYRGGAGFVFVPTQIAYAVSGGVAGVALIGAGLGIANVQFTRLHTARRSAKLRVLIAETVEVLTLLRDDPAALDRAGAAASGRVLNGPPAGRSRGTREAGRPLPGSSAADNGQGLVEDHALFRRPLTWSTPTVLASRTVFHHAGCRALTRLRDPVELSLEDARARGLSPCRLCNPLT